MLPAKSWESGEVGIGGHYSAAMLDCNRRVLGIGDQIPGGSGFAAQPLEDLEVIGAGPHDARCRAFRERGHECESLV